MMRFRKEVLCTLLAAAMCCTPVLSGCSSKEQSIASQKESGAEENQTPASETEDELGESAGNLGEFSIKDVNDETYTQEMFADYDLTMVNVFTTWCTYQ